MSADWVTLVREAEKEAAVQVNEAMVRARNLQREAKDRARAEAEAMAADTAEECHDILAAGRDRTAEMERQADREIREECADLQKTAMPRVEAVAGQITERILNAHVHR